MMNEAKELSLFAGLEAMPTKLDQSFEKELEAKKKVEDDVIAKENMDFVSDFIDAPLEEVKQMPLGLKIHLGIASLLCIGSFIAFRYLVSPSPAAPGVFQWWIYPWLFFGMTVSGHHYLSKGNKWTASALILIILHVALFLLNKQLTPSVDWFWYPLFLSIMIGMGFYYSNDGKTSRLATVTYLYLVLSVLMVITWLNLQRFTNFPWFVYPILGLAIPLAIWYLKSVYDEKRLWIYAFVIALFVNIMTVITWGFIFPVTNPSWNWPWFIISIGVTYAITFGLYVYHRQDSKNPLFSFQRKYENPYDAPIDPRDAKAEPEQSMFKDQGEDAGKVSLDDVVDGEYDYTG